MQKIIQDIKMRVKKKTDFPTSNTKREVCRPALLDIGESLSAYLQADLNILLE